ncbi:hypothetical protein EGO51_19285 [Haloarcula hispanica]|uniref:Uncharacterized protein n=2 Tax=Haloarcula hispanica TaxID=51589 RepID=A0A5J5LCL0_HALHI|nr:hypothetical protein EGO51_19285 [Haloarcula hispanica]
MSKTDETKEVTFDELPEPEQNNDSGWISLEPGEEYGGQITDFEYDERNGSHVVEINGRPFSLNNTQLTDLLSSLVFGAKIGLRCSEKEESFTGDDGEEVTYNPTELRAVSDGDA